MDFLKIQIFCDVSFGVDISMTHAKNTPRTPTKERPNMVHLDAIRFITFRRPERMMTQNGRVTSILICLHQSKTTNRRNREERFKIDIIINSHIHPFFPLLQIQLRTRPVDKWSVRAMDI
jgi:hypothetical protein